MDRLLPDFLNASVIDVNHAGIFPLKVLPSLLQKNRIHIWSAAYSDIDRHFELLSQYNSTEERYKASLFRNSADSRRYLLRNGLLRVILGNYTCHDPETISLVIGKNGKPELDPRDDSADVSFNVSHTSERILIGITQKTRIGIDIVKMDPSYQYHAIAEYILTPAEKAFMQTIDSAWKHQFFFRIWALKEAILKSTGDTLSMMKETDTTDILLKGFPSVHSPMKYRNSDRSFFIWQFNSGPDHYSAIAAEIGSRSLDVRLKKIITRKKC